MHHFARRGGDIFTQLERLRIDMGQLAALEIAQQVFKAFDQALPIGLGRLFHHQRVEHRKVGRAQRFDQCPRGELELLVLGRIAGRGRIGHCQHLLGQHQVGLVDQRIERLFAPFGVSKAAVLAWQSCALFTRFIGLGTYSVLAEHPFPQRDTFIP